MGRPRIWPPNTHHHKATNTDRVWINGQCITLGPHGSPEARKCYSELVLQAAHGTLAQSTDPAICELVLAYLDFAETYYEPDGREIYNVKLALRPIVERWGTIPARDFGPLKLIEYQEWLIDRGLARSEVNRRVDHVRRMFRWAVSREMAKGQQLVELKAVRRVRQGYRGVRETKKRQGVAWKEVRKLLGRGKLPRPIRGMILVGWLSGARPGELRRLRVCDLDRSHDACWVFQPTKHKTAKRGRTRVIVFGRRAICVLRIFIDENQPEQHLFRPSQARSEQARRVGCNTKTPLPPSDEDCYRPSSISQAIRRACEKHGANWVPYQLRHAAKRRAKQVAGIEGAKAMLGHESINTTELYDSLDLEAAKAVAALIG
jgi:integrase